MDYDICSDSSAKASTYTESALASPNYAYSYQNNKNCHFTITTGFSHLCVEIDFVTLDLEESHNCQYDSLSFYNGSTVDENKLVKRMCGNDPGQQPIKFNSSTITVQFKTDSSVVGKGFNLKFQTVLCKGNESR